MTDKRAMIRGATAERTGCAAVEQECGMTNHDNLRKRDCERTGIYFLANTGLDMSCVRGKGFSFRVVFNMV